MVPQIWPQSAVSWLAGVFGFRFVGFVFMLGKVAYVKRGMPARGFHLANRGEGRDFGPGSEFVAFFGFAGADVADHSLPWEVSDVAVIEGREQWAVGWDVTEVGDCQLELRESLQVGVLPFAVTELCAGSWPHEAVGDGESGVDIIAVGVLGGIDGLEDNHEHVAFAGFAFGNLGFGDGKWLLAFNEERHGGVDIVEDEAEGWDHNVCLCLLCLCFSSPEIGERNWECFFGSGKW